MCSTFMKRHVSGGGRSPGGIKILRCRAPGSGSVMSIARGTTAGATCGGRGSVAPQRPRPRGPRQRRCPYPGIEVIQDKEATPADAVRPRLHRVDQRSVHAAGAAAGAVERDVRRRRARLRVVRAQAAHVDGRLHLRRRPRGSRDGVHACERSVRRHRGSLARAGRRRGARGARRLLGAGHGRQRPVGQEADESVGDQRREQVVHVAQAEAQRRRLLERLHAAADLAAFERLQRVQRMARLRRPGRRATASRSCWRRRG